MPHLSTLVCRQLLLLVFVLTIAAPVRALGPILLPTSFEEIVGGSTHIVIGTVTSTAKHNLESGISPLQFRRESVVKVTKILKGELTSEEIRVEHEVIYHSVDIQVTEGKSYLLFLCRRKGSNHFVYTDHRWTSWEIVGDQIVNTQSYIQRTTQLPFSGFVASIRAQLLRKNKPLIHRFSGITYGDGVQAASRATGLHFQQYDKTSKDREFERYYAVPTGRNERLITLDVYRGQIVQLNIYLSRDSEDTFKYLRKIEAMAGATPLEGPKNLSFVMGRMWSDSRVIVRLGELGFLKNQFPWGAFDGYEISVTDRRNVLEQFRKGNARGARGK